MELRQDNEKKTKKEGKNETKQDETSQEKTIARHDTTETMQEQREDKIEQRQDKIETMTEQRGDKTEKRQDKTKENKTMTRQDKTRQDKTRQARENRSKVPIVARTKANTALAERRRHIPRRHGTLTPTLALTLVLALTRAA